MLISKKLLLSICDYIMLILIFIISLVNIVGLIAFIIFSFYLFIQKEKGILKLVLLLTLRFIINESIDYNHGYLYLISLYKYALLFIVIPIILIFKAKLILADSILKKFLFYTIGCFLVFFITSLIVSKYPLVSLMKLMNYFIPLIEIVILTYLVRKKFDFLKWLSNYFIIIFLFSLSLIMDYKGYLLNGFSFQGILNHPNIFGVLSVLGIVIILTYCLTSNLNLFNNIFLFCIIAIAILELILTNSRSSFLALLLSLIIILIFSKISIILKFFISSIFIIANILLISIPTVFHFLMDFIRKGQSSEHILLSRYGQINNLEFVLNNSPIFGIGFGIPVNMSSIELNDFVFEAGNLFVGLIIFTGVFGLLMYALYVVGIIFIRNKINREFLIIILSTILVNTGEMIMFSSNNVGIYCYVLWAIYIATEQKYKKSDVRIGEV
ncbi:O-antigen ligase family protein [Staphylococcus sp. GDY8P168P-1]|uniref:O-antigen ligase family protein n=1 Tax=Staphylococcus sp. GDY8P168P-1 TaxID=2804167 RepID=UPI001AEBE5BB